MKTIRKELIMAGCNIENSKIDFFPVWGNRFIAIQTRLAYSHKSKEMIDAILDKEFDEQFPHPFVTVLTAQEKENYLYKITFDTDFGMVIHKMVGSEPMESKPENGHGTMFTLEL